MKILRKNKLPYLLLHGDCIKEMSKFEDYSVDAIITDPPYGTTACKWDSVISFALMWEQLNRIIKQNGAIAMFCQQPFTSSLVVSNVLCFKYCFVWVKNKKTGFLNAKKQPLRQNEEIAIFYKKQPTYNPQKTSGHKPVNSFTKHTSDGQTVGKTKKGISGGGQTDRFPSNILHFPVVNNDKTNKDKFHPTQKPVPLMEYLIKTYTNEGETVLDFTMGSGSTGVACLNTNRKFIGIEKDDKYFEIAKNRIEEHYKTLK